MSPFEGLVDDLTARIRHLPASSQVALFLSAGLALSESWTAWATASNLAPDHRLLDRVREAVESHLADGSDALPAGLLAEIEAATPSEPTEIPGFTAAQDCWICIDTSVRAGLGEFDAANSTWYLLEPAFQSVSEQLFGLADVGSDRQETDEQAALSQPQMRSAVEAVERAIDALADLGPGQTSTSDLIEVLGAIRP